MNKYIVSALGLSGLLLLGTAPGIVLAQEATTTGHTTRAAIAAMEKKRRLGDTRHHAKTIGGMMMRTMRKRTTRIVPLRGAILGPSGDSPRLVIVSGRTERGKRYIV